MNRFRQHIPMFVNDGEGGVSFTFETTEELLAHDVVRRHIGPKHSHFVMGGRHLMEISDEGFEWWVVGFVEKPEEIALPQWEGWKHLVRLPDGTEAVLTDEVVSSCGGQLTLRDGTIVTDVRFERRMAKHATDRAKEDLGICPNCDLPYRRRESPDLNHSIKLEQSCDQCGRRLTSWRPGGVQVLVL